FDPYRLKSVPMHEPLSTLVYAGEQSNVDTVVIDGKVVLEGCRFTSIDEEASVREVHERALALSRRTGTFRLVEGRRFTPFGYDHVRSSAPARPASPEHARQSAAERVERVESELATSGEARAE